MRKSINSKLFSYLYTYTDNTKLLRNTDINKHRQMRTYGGRVLKADGDEKCQNTYHLFPEMATK